MISLIIPGTPIAKKRPRFVRRGKFVGTYNPQETEEGRFLFEIKNQYKNPTIEDPVSLSCQFDMPIPKGTSVKKKSKMIEGQIKHTKRPDVDNLLKFVLDCLNGVVIKDDSQIYVIMGVKSYSENPKTVIVINEL